MAHTLSIPPNENDDNAKFWLFGTYRYYPSGGINDFIGTYDTLEEARKEVLDVGGEFDYYTAIEVRDNKPYREIRPIKGICIYCDKGTAYDGYLCDECKWEEEV